MMSRSKLCFFAIATGWLMTSLATAGMKTVVYPLLFGDPEALESFAKQVVADEGHVVLDGRGSRLIVVTTPDRHETLNEVLGKADAQTGNVRLDVRFHETGATRDTAAGVRGNGDVTIGRDGWSGSIELRPELRHHTTNVRDDTTQTLMVASGREAVLRVGEQVPYLDWLTTYGWQGGYLTSQVQWQDVGAFLVVTPTILHDGQTVHVRITPELRGLVDGQPLRTSFTSVATELYVRNGETVTLGGFGKDREFSSRFLIGQSRTGEQRTLDITLSPRIIGADGRSR